MLESIARSFGYIYGREKGVRINTISQSPTPTTAGKGIKDLENMMDSPTRCRLWVTLRPKNVPTIAS